MGITHYTILNSIIKNADFSFIEPNWKINFLLKNNIKAHFYKNDKNINKAFDLCLITTPPFVHKQIVMQSLKVIN